MLKVAIIGVMAMFLAMFLKKDKPEFSMLIVMCTCLIIIGLSLSKLDRIIEQINIIGRYMGDNSVYLTLLLKIIGVTYVAEFSSNLCRDAGYGAIANQVDFFGKLLILAISLPIFEAVIEIITG